MWNNAKECFWWIRLTKLTRNSQSFCQHCRPNHHSTPSPPSRNWIWSWKGEIGNLISNSKVFSRGRVRLLLGKIQIQTLCWSSVLYIFFVFFFINETFFWQNIEIILSFTHPFWFSIQSNLLCLSLSESRKTFQIKLMQHQLLLCGSKSCKKYGQISIWNGIWKISKRYIESACYHLIYFFVFSVRKATRKTRSFWKVREHSIFACFVHQF